MRAFLLLLLISFTLSNCRAQEFPDARSIELKGAVADRRVSTPLGPMIVRWPRAVEECFGRSPSRAVADAAQTISRAIAQAKFDSRLKSGRREWSLLFLDRATAAKQLPFGSIMSNHPGFMVPPNKIYIIAESITGSCLNGARSPVSDELLARVLVHEMAHVLEFVLLEPRGPNEKFRSEGFATWLEGYAADRSSIIDGKLVRAELLSMAKEADSTGSFVPEGFNGSIQHYARASMYFNAIVARRGVAALMDVYEVMARDGIGLFQAVEKAISWNRATLEREVRKVLHDGH